MKNILISNSQIAAFCFFFALSSCQQQETPVTPTTETTAPIVVTPVKSEIASAPSSVAGKTIVIISSNGKEEYSFPNGNTSGKYPNGERVYRNEEGWDDKPYCVYAKSSTTKAVLKVRGVEFMADYELSFITQTEGTAKGKGESEADEDGWKNDNLRFTIK